DPAGVQSMITKLSAQKQALEQVRSTVNSTIASATSVWKGPDVGKFQSDWHGHQASLQRAEQAIEELITKARTNMAQQHQTSSSY
ncbi:MAG: WXG100 family type VII secretion target, partial [Trebonia sp.]